MNEKGNKVTVETKRHGIEGDAILIEKVKETKKRERWYLRFIGENRIYQRTISK